jgi:hypothetical protein
VKEIGKRWVQLTSFFPFRSDISLKNRFFLLTRKKQTPDQLIGQNDKDSGNSSLEEDFLNFGEISFDWLEFLN